MSADVPRIGHLRDRVALFRKDVTAEPEGGHMTVFVPLATVWARVHARPASLAAFAEARGVTATHVVVMRFRSDIGAGDRMTFQGRALDVLSVEDFNGKRAFVTCACAERSVVG